MSQKILVVEDHPDTLELLSIQLRRLSYEIVVATSGEEGLEKAMAEIPDLVIMDLGLPGISGIEATSRLKSQPQTTHIPVIALTAWRKEDHEEEALTAGISAYLVKPTPPVVLKQLLERFLRPATSV